MESIQKVFSYDWPPFEAALSIYNVAFFFLLKITFEEKSNKYKGDYH